MRRLFAVICVSAIAMLIPAAAALGQATDQYTPSVSPVLDPAGVIAEGGTGGESASGGAKEAGEAAETGGGELPFTGYPMTPLLWLVLLLLLGGIALRTAVPTLDRRST